MYRYLLSREGMQIAGGCWPPSAECKSLGILQQLCKLGLVSSILQRLPSGAQGSAARFAPWESASVTAASRRWKAMEAPYSASSGRLGWCSAETRPRIQLQGCAFDPLQRLGTWEPWYTGKGKRAAGTLKPGKKLIQNIFSMYFNCFLCRFAPACILPASMVA